MVLSAFIQKEKRERLYASIFLCRGSHQWWETASPRTGHQQQPKSNTSQKMRGVRFFFFKQADSYITNARRSAITYFFTFFANRQLPYILL